MRNYIVLNGKDSRLVNGLLIQSLAPITKPKIRTIIEEIDGRDGDIVTKLGYSAYDKEILIGLYGDFDIDDIISYFNSEGKVTFSNESDLYYKYKILEQIDFERLVKFRTAKVKFHVQPFKYSNIEKSRTFSSQANLLVPPDGIFTNMGLTSNIKDGVIHVTGTATGTYANCMARRDVVLPAGNYVLSVNEAPPCQFRLYIRGENKVRTVWMKEGTTSMNFTLEEPSTLYYYYLGTTKDETYDFSVEPLVTGSQGETVTTVEIVNNGNYYSKPILKVKGTGIVYLYLNNIQIFAINLGDLENEIIIDTENMEAYNTDNILMNRSVSGDYSKFQLNSGKNTITWSGEVEQISIENYSRWI